MDWIELRQKVLCWVRKYKYALLILVLGLTLMALPDGSQNAQFQPQQTTCTDDGDDMVTQLEQILSQIDGAGEVRVMLSTATGQRTYYQTDDDVTDTALRSDTVIITDEQRAQQGLIQQIDSPSYRGAIVVCQGADRAAIRLAIVEAVANVTGLGVDRISVLKMK